MVEMMQNDSKTGHSIVIVTDRVERSISVVAVLEDAGYQVSVAQGLYEGLRQIDQNMPHLVIAGSIYYDGTIANLQDRLQENPLLANTPILAWIPSKTKTQLLPLKDRKFTGFILGKASGSTLIEKMREILEPLASLSPYLLPLETIQFEETLHFSTNAAIISHEDNYLLIESGMKVGMLDEIQGWRQQEHAFKFVLSRGQSLRVQDRQLAVFPMRQLRHPLRAWMESLTRTIRAPEKANDKTVRILHLDAIGHHDSEDKPILAGYGIECDHLGSIPDLIAKQSESLKEHYHGILVEGFKADHPDLLRLCQLQRDHFPFPTLLIKLEKPNSAGYGPGIRYLTDPCQFGDLLDQLMMLRFTNPSLPPASETHRFLIQGTGRLIGLDENGGVFEFHQEIAAQTELQIEHTQLIDLWEGEKRVTVLQSNLKPGSSSNTWYIAFKSMQSFGNKAKYWQRLQTKLESLKESTRASA